MSEPGRVLGTRLPFPLVHGDPARTLRTRWHQVDAFVAVLAVGATVRLIAPLLADKATDPAVVCLDDAGRHAVVLCGAHRGGNELARELAGLVGAEPVLTTATDALGIVALDQLPGVVARGDVAGATSLVLAGAGLAVSSPSGWPVPPALAALDDPTSPASVVVTDAVSSPGATVVLHPPSLVVGIGTSRDATPAEARAAVQGALRRSGLAQPSVGRVSTIDRRATHDAVVGVAATLGAGLTAYGADQLDAVAVPNPSDTVRRAVGTASVAEAAAILGAGPGGRLAVEKQSSARVTVAIARRGRPEGGLAVVGLGPGRPEHRTPAATRAVRHAEVVVGYQGYLDQCHDLLERAQEVRAFPLGAEMERARYALEEAEAGRRVALVCSGDAGVYAMASPVLELAGTPGADGRSPFAGVEVELVPGVTASLAAAAVLGAPLGHDHAVISLSDLHTPWERIAERVTAAAASDFVIVLYNPRSARRTWQIETVKQIVLEHRDPATPVGLVTDAGRAGQRSRIVALADLPCDQVTMTTCVIVGSSTTRTAGGRMVTPRGYDR
ncbi:MAG TPA: precorrin-3B C(17)-methyltransferase [Acidimicrobiales bacterium]